MSTAPSPAQAAAIAAHRFGLGEADLNVVGSDAAGWLAAQIGPAAPMRGEALPSSRDAVLRHAEIAQQRRAMAMQNAAREAAMEVQQRFEPQMALPERAAEPPDPLRNLVTTDIRARLLTASTSRQPFNERLALFWANHFSVSVLKGAVRGFVGAFEREAIRPHIGGSFEALLKAAVTHPAMLYYLDNVQSAGPNSRFVMAQARRPRGAGEGPRISGLNENLAREVLELHTLGVSGGGAAYGGWGGYTQADVTALARVLTGWRVPAGQIAAGTLAAGDDVTRFDASWHEPGAKTVLGKRYPEGPEGLGQALHDLAVHPSTARFIATKLARHFVADEPPPALVARLAARFRATDGDLPSVYRELIQSPQAWAAEADSAGKLKSPEEFVISTTRLLALGDNASTALFARQFDGGTGVLGQRVHAVPSPAGWPDRAEEWLGPDAVWKRVEWATRVAERAGRQVDARALARASLGPRLGEATARQIERAADGPQALALLLLSPEFQRR